MIRIFNHYVLASYFILLLIEGLVFFLSIYAGTMVRFWAVDITAGDMGPLWPRAITILSIYISTMTAMGMYDRHSRNSINHILLHTAIAFTVGFVLTSWLFYILPDLYVGRGVLLISIILAFIWVVTGRVIFTKYLGLKNINQRILVLGAGKKAATLEKILRRRVDRHGIDLVAYVAMSDDPVINKSKIISYDDPLKEMVCKNNIDEIVLAVDDRRHEFPLDEIVDCRMDGIIVSDFVTFIEKRACKILVSDLDPSWLMYSDGFSHGVFGDIVKRAFDISVSSLLIVLFFPVFLLSVLAMYIEDGCRGGFFYFQNRVGLNGQIYTIYKIRSMRAGSEAGGKVRWASENDDRVTRVGRVLRKFRIDEFPQLLNVIKGNMSFVGPRPERPEFVNTLSQDIPYFNERHRVKPGITGWAQICYPYGASRKDSLAKLEYDLYYVKNCNIFLDLVVLFQTAQVVLFGKGAR